MASDRHNQWLRLPGNNHRIADRLLALVGRRYQNSPIADKLENQRQ